MDAQSATIYQFNRKNQLITEEYFDGIKQFTYDKQGGIVEEKNSMGIQRFSYNSHHQQTRVKTETGNMQENRYDVENLRFQLLENGRCTSFVYHNGELLYEEGGNKKQSSYHLGAEIDAVQRGRGLSYYHRNEQLSTAFITDRQGEIQNSYQYDAFGVQLEAAQNFQNRIRYTGQQYDESTEQYYLRARYYNPVLGRFMQEDVYQGDSLNLYAYCGNNPVIYYDPSGYAVECHQEQTGGDGGNGGNDNNSKKYKKASIWERLFKRSADVNELYPNPSDAFSNPAIGPSDSALSRHIKEIIQTGRISDPITVQKLAGGGYEIVSLQLKEDRMCANGISWSKL